MKFSKYEKKYIFCVEGNWTSDLKHRTSIKSALDFLEHNADTKYIYRNCSTIEQLEELLKYSLLKKYDKYGILYLGFHGHPGSLQIGQRKIIDLDTIAEIINGDAKDKIIHFGSCNTLKISSRKLDDFCKKTGALAISGYTKEIDFRFSMLFDVFYFHLCQLHKKISLIENDINLYDGKLAKELGFKMCYRK